MRVVATAGHVDHGKSALIRALTGMEPDRWAEERRRGMTIDLGFAWADIGTETIAFVDVPGHQRFVTNMLAGVGPVPAVLFVVAADAGWSRQSSEHLDALQALGIPRAVVAISKVDLVPPDTADRVAADALEHLAGAGIEATAVPVSAVTGAGLPQLQAALQELVAGLPEPSTTGRIRLWIDRVFTVRGAGTVVTGTLGSGRIAVGDTVQLPGGTATVKQLEQLGRPAPAVVAVSRVAVNLRGIDRAELQRGDVLTTPDAWWWTDTVDVALDPLFTPPGTRQTLHIGSASLPVRVRRLGDGAARLTLDRAIPVQPGDRALLRDPGLHSITAGVRVLDVDPAPLSRRGDARRHGAELLAAGVVTSTAKVARDGAVPITRLRRMAYPDDAGTARLITVAGWLIDPDRWSGWQRQLIAAVDRQAAADPRQPGLSTEAGRRALQLPAELLPALADKAGLELSDGRIRRPGAVHSVGSAFDWLAERWQREPLYAPDRNELAERRLTVKDLATADRTGAAIRLAPDLVVAPHAIEFALSRLAELDQPFTVSAARQHLASTRRVMVPLLEHLDRLGHTRADGDGRRRLTG